MLQTLIYDGYLVAFAIISTCFWYRYYFSFLRMVAENVWYLMWNMTEVYENFTDKSKTIFGSVMTLIDEIQKRRIDIDILEDKVMRVGFYYKGKYGYITVPYQKDGPRTRVTLVSKSGKSYEVTQHIGLDYLVDPNLLGGHYLVDGRHVVNNRFRLLPEEETGEIDEGGRSLLDYLIREHESTQEVDTE